VAFCLDLSKGVHMREPYISTVMETIDPPVSATLTDAKVIELWAQRQRAADQEHLPARHPATASLYWPEACENQRTRSGAIHRSPGPARVSRQSPRAARSPPSG